MPNEYICTVDNIDIVMEELLDDYLMQDVLPAMKKGITKTTQKMVRDTKKEAPVDGGKWNKFPAHREGGTYLKHIGYNTRDFGLSFQGIWRVRSPEYRLTHLLENGHRLFIFGRPTGRFRTKSLDFVERARNVAADTVIPNIIKELP